MSFTTWPPKISAEVWDKKTIVFFPDHDHDSVRSIIMQQNIHKVNYSAVGKLKAIWNFNLKITFLWTQLKAQICGKREQKL